MTNSFFEPPFWESWGNVRTLSIDRWKVRARFIFAVIEHFSLALTFETLLADIGRSRRFSKGVGHFKCKFQVEGDIAHQPVFVSAYMLRAEKGTAIENITSDWWQHHSVINTVLGDETYNAIRTHQTFHNKRRRTTKEFVSQTADWRQQVRMSAIRQIP